MEAVTPVFPVFFHFDYDKYNVLFFININESDTFQQLFRCFEEESPVCGIFD